MAARLVHSFTDDNPDFHKQIGCMNGIFHLFDRHNATTTKRITHKNFPPGHSQSNCGDLVSTVHHQEKANESSLNENAHEKRSMTAESSRDSLSSCSSSLSSTFTRINVLESPSRGSALDHSNTISYSKRQPFNIKQTVTDSMHREVRTSFVKMTDVDNFDHGAKYRDSPRPPPMTKCAEISSRVGRNRKHDIPIDIDESFRVLAKLKDASKNFNDGTERPRTSYDAHGRSPRLSYDGRERSQFSFESRNSKSSPKVKELPRLSLDSRENLVFGFSSVSPRTPICRNVQNSSCSTDKAPELHHSSGNRKRMPSVVAKLMGLETLPDLFSASDSLCGGESLAKSLESRNLKTSASDKISSKCPTSPRRKNHDLLKKPIPTSRLPIEIAPWRKQDRTQVSKSTAFRPVKGSPPSSSPFVHGEVKMRLKDLELEQSNKDLRALKKILEAIQIRALSEIGMEEQGSVLGIQRNQEPSSSSPNSKSRLTSQRNRRSGAVVASSTTCKPNSSKSCESPIIMRAAKPVEKSVISTSMMPMDYFPMVHKVQNEGFQDSKKGSSNSQTRSRIPKNTQKDLAVFTSEKKPISRNIRSPQTSPKLQLVSKENTTSSIKSSDSVSPRLRLRKAEVPKSDTNKPKRKMKQTDSNCQCGKINSMSSNIRQGDDQSSEMSNESRALSCQSDDMTEQLDANLDIEVINNIQPTKIDGDERQVMEAAELLTTSSVKKLSMVAISEDGSTMEQDATALEHPSPVSVLDGSFYRDDEASPVKMNTTILDVSLEGDESLDSNERRSEARRNLSDDIFVNHLVSNHNVEIDSMKFENIEDLIQKLRHLNNLQHDEAEKDYFGLLCENTNPDHRYILEILLASGLLLRDLGSDMTSFQHHPSGNPINPELFYVLEKTKAGGLPRKEGFNPARASYSHRERFHRKLIFDAVNEILVEKLALIDGCALEQPWLKPTKIAQKSFSGQKILKLLCNEIEQCQANKFECNFDEEKNDSKSILQDNVMRQSRNWTDFHGDFYGVVLDVERLIFKDLVSEIAIR